MKVGCMLRDRFTSRSGAVLYYVVAFVTFAFVAVLVFLYGEHQRGLPELRRGHDLQSLLNARSGVWKTIEFLTDTNVVDSSTTLNTLDDDFGKDMFGADTIGPRDPLTELSDPENPVALALFPTDSFGTAEGLVITDPVLLTVVSKGDYRGKTRSVKARLGGRAFGFPDTVLFLGCPCPSGGRITGECVTLDTQLVEQRSRFAVRLDDLKTLISGLEKDLTFSGDSGEKAPDLTIQNLVDLKELPETVEGLLQIDGSLHDLHWKEDRTINILGDLEFWGDAVVENVRFMVMGSIKVNDKTKLRNVTLMTKAELFIGDKCEFSGTAMARSKIVIFGDARVRDKSVMVVLGGEAAAAQTKPPPLKGKQPAGGGGGGETPATPATTVQPFTLFVSDRAEVDGVFVALGTPGGIKTDERTAIAGVLWAAGTVCHLGELQGVIRANMVVDCDQTDPNAAPPPGQPPPVILVEGQIKGKVAPLDSIVLYSLPFFMGEYAIVDWSEE